MKKTLFATATAAVLFVAVSPAFAQSYDPDVGSGNLTQWFDNSDRRHPNADVNVPYDAYGSYAQVPGGYPTRPAVRQERSRRLFDNF